ncbi:MAG: tetratricopeptide repeat protein [Telluria sp.]
MKRLLPLTLLLALAACAHSQTQPAADSASLQQDLYQDALQSIAEGRRNDASLELRRLIEKEPLHAGAWLELALMQCALGYSDEAERLFATIETRFAPAKPTPGWESILRVIAEAREQGCNQWHPSSSASVTIGRGIDQNVNQGALNATYMTEGPTGPVSHELTSDFRPMHDQYTLLAGDWSRDITRNSATAFVQYAMRRNDQLRQYDSGAAFAGAAMPWRLGHWLVQGSATGGLVTLGGSLYQRQVQAQARVTPPLPLPASLQFSMLFGFSYNGYLTLTNFNNNVWETRGQLTWRRPDTYASVSLGRLDDRALAQRPGGDRQGWFGNAFVRRRVGERTSGELGFTRQTWDSKLSYAPGLIDEVRAQRTNVLRASVTYNLSKTQSLQLEGRVVHNRENISIFQYNDHQLQLSWQWQGF